MVHRFLLYPFVRRDILSTTLKFNASSSCITLAIALDISHFICLLLFILVIRIFLFIRALLIPINMFYCAIFTFELYVNKDTYMWAVHRFNPLWKQLYAYTTARCHTDMARLSYQLTNLHWWRQITSNGCKSYITVDGIKPIFPAKCSGIPWSTTNRALKTKQLCNKKGSSPE